MIDSSYMMIRHMTPLIGARLITNSHQDKFEKLLEKMKNFVDNKELFVFDGFVGADPEYSSTN